MQISENELVPFAFSPEGKVDLASRGGQVFVVASATDF